MVRPRAWASRRTTSGGVPSAMATPGSSLRISTSAMPREVARSKKVSRSAAGATRWFRPKPFMAVPSLETVISFILYSDHAFQKMRRQGLLPRPEAPPSPHASRKACVRSDAGFSSRIGHSVLCFQVRAYSGGDRLATERGAMDRNHVEERSVDTTPQTFDALRQILIERSHKLPKRLAQVAAFAMANPDEIALGTAASVAQGSDVQPSTVVRFAQALGFAGFSELQSVFRERLRDRAPSRSGRSSPGACRTCS